MKFHMSITERRVTLRVEPESDTEAAFLRVLCHQGDVDDIREQMNAHRYSDRAPAREIVAESCWTSHLNYGLDKVTAIEMSHTRKPAEPPSQGIAK